MKIRIWTSDKVTGGPLALRQLAAELEAYGAQVELVDATQSLASVSRHDLRFAARDLSRDLGREDALISPEIWAPVLVEVPTARRVLWWLSVDKAYRWENAFGDRAYDYLPPVAFRISRAALRLPLNHRLRATRNRSIIHATQSEYARNHVERVLGGRSVMLTDYLEDQAGPAARAVGRESLVAYNPAKGIPATRRVMQVATGNLDFVPVVGMDRDGVRELLSRAAVYLDLGAHPGRDRLPREAALSGCVVIVGDRGAANNPVDMPLPESLRVNTPRSDAAAAQVFSKLAKILDELEKYQGAMASYVDWIRTQPVSFRQEVGELLHLLEHDRS